MKSSRVLILFFVLCSFSIAQIDKKELLQTVELLSSKEFAGRLPGHSGYTKAANFISGEMTKLKLKPAGDSEYFQKLKVEYNEILAPEHFAIIKSGTRTEYKLGPDYVYRGFTGSGKLIANTAFCGYGLSQPELGYDDYANIDVKGKVK